MDVDTQPSRAVEWAYPTRNDSVVVTIWHDQIRTDMGVDILYYVPTIYRRVAVAARVG